MDLTPEKKYFLNLKFVAPMKAIIFGLKHGSYDTTGVQKLMTTLITYEVALKICLKDSLNLTKVMQRVMQMKAGETAVNAAVMLESFELLLKELTQILEDYCEKKEAIDVV